MKNNKAIIGTIPFINGALLDNKSPVSGSAKNELVPPIDNATKTATHANKLSPANFKPFLCSFVKSEFTSRLASPLYSPNLGAINFSVIIVPNVANTNVETIIKYMFIVAFPA